ncbi:MAG TPA: DinB family protein [Vicinamibacterales bacterium]|jgi:hypothetical protein|nr:DinB family protein [Vicinamibacterales bacterium]
MSSVASHDSAAVSVASPERGTSLRAQALADRLIQGGDALAAFASGLSDAEWQTRLQKDGRKIGVVVHHVASVYPVEMELARAVASGHPVTGLTPADIDQMNARHAVEHDNATREATLNLLRRNSADAAAAIRTLSDDELDRAVLVSLYSYAPLTCQFVLEDHAVRHSYHHLARIRATLGR